jgi:hypothetical protein
MIEYVKYRSDKFDDVGTQCEDLSSYHVLNFYKFYGASDIIEQDTVFFRKAIPSFSLAVKHPKLQESNILRAIPMMDPFPNR